MKKAIYIHGLGSSSNSSTGKYLKDNLRGYAVLVPSIPFKPKEAREFVKNLILNQKPDLVVASSLGAFYVLISNLNLPITKVLVNPAMYPHDDIKESIGLGVDYGNGNIIDKNFLGELGYLEDKYSGYAYNEDEYKPNTYALFGTNDELFSHIEDFKEYFNEDKMKLIPSGHHLKDTELYYLIDYINEVTNKTK